MILDTDLNICQRDDDCAYMENSKCSKIKDTSISKCECKPNFYFLNKTCVSRKLLITLIKNIYFKMYFFSESDLNFCQNNDDCAHKENSKCSKIKTFSVGTCECENNNIYIEKSCVSCKLILIN